jgi:nickel-dependent lactate racemase
MKIQVPYGGIVEEVEFPDGTVVLQPAIQPLLDDDQIRRKISEGFAEYKSVLEDKVITIVINDHTRHSSASAVLRYLLELIPAERMQILVATGTHRTPDDEELHRILGRWRGVFDGRIHIHDCRDKDSLVNLGKTSRGTLVAVSRRIMESEAAICINSVEPHFFAGFTGGRKSLVPGLAAFETVVANHVHAKSENARSLNLRDNPVHLDLEEAAGMVAEMPIISIQLVSRANGIIDIFCGNMKDSFARAAEKAREAFSVLVEKNYDIVFAVGEPPLDANLYQLQKAQEHGAEAVRKGGILVVAGACHEGAGSPYFVSYADDYPTPESALSGRAMNDNRFGIHKLIKTARRLKEIKIWYVTNLDDKVIQKLYFEPKKSIRAALQDALDFFGGSACVAVLRDACFLVPVENDVKGGW